MNNVTPLPSRRERTALGNREELVRRAREETAAFGQDLDFDALTWDITKHCPRPSGKAGQKVILYFANHENGTAKGIEGRTPLNEPFGSVIKAIVRLKKENAPRIGEGPLSILVRTSRFLEPLLDNRGYDPCLLVPADFDEACEAIKRRIESPDSRYRLGVALENLSVALARNHLTKFAFRWKNTFTRPDASVRVGAQAEKARAKKLPPEEVLDELARISHLITEPSDLILMGLIKLMHCAPWRVGEPLTLPADCWVEQPKVDANGPVVDENGEPIIHCGIRYWVEKVQRWDIKWLPTVMVPIANKAIETIISLTQGARDLAKWYEEHPGQAWLPGPDRGPFQEYTMEDVATLFGLAGKGGARQWLTHREIPINRDREEHTVYRSDLEPALLEAWHKYDYLENGSGNIKRSKLLFLTFANQNNFRNTNPCCIAPTTDQHISDFLSGRGDKESGKIQSIFERFDSVDTHGNPFRMNSHQFRHWMNTIAQRGALSELLVARWSGRKEVSQNSVYDHVGPLELAEKARDLMAGGHVLGALAEVHDRLPPKDRSTFRKTVFTTALVTDIGMCDADFISTPCPEFGACSTCDHCNIIKGDQAARDRSIKVLDDTRWLLKRTIEEEGEGAVGASNYIDAYQQKLDSLEKIISIHDDPTIPDGTWVRPNKASRDHFGGPKLKGHDEEGKGA